MQIAAYNSTHNVTLDGKSTRGARSIRSCVLFMKVERKPLISIKT